MCLITWSSNTGDSIHLYANSAQVEENQFMIVIRDLLFLKMLRFPSYKILKQLKAKVAITLEKCHVIIGFYFQFDNAQLVPAIFSG